MAQSTGLRLDPAGQTDYLEAQKSKRKIEMNQPAPSANLAPGPAWALFLPFGRINRAAFWLCFAFVWVVIAISLNVWVNSVETLPDTLDQIMEQFINSNPLIPILLMVLQWIELALVMKRFQDMGRSGLFALLSLVPFINFFVLIAVGALPGQAGPNRYGPETNSYYRRK